MKFKRWMAMATAAVLAFGTLAGCGQSGKKTESTAASAESSAEASGKKLKIVATIFPEYDWVRQILGDEAKNADITLLLDKGVDLHSYQPNAEDIAKISECDLFLYVGGESDGWVKDALKEGKNPNRKVINLLEALGNNTKEEEVVEGMQAEEEEGSKDSESTAANQAAESQAAGESTAASAESEEEEGPEYDEHVWLSLRNAESICEVITEDLKSLDSAHAAVYDANLKKYTEQLDSLDQQYTDTVKAAANKTLLFGDRFPFRYLVDDYGIKYYAAFVGCSAETEASFETVSFLAKKMDELGLKHVMTIEGPNKKIAETIIQNTKDKNQDILTLNSMQSTTEQDIESGETYLGIMQQNLEVLKKALQ
ncbi:metal ABC transporter substrate-binding protein [Stomatobaculum longum]|uniref:metal ABC transporter substrate-binding protein n=1 Tax=Stomatobaculum longum TaxID=796942 RepID=UPI0028EEB224|nr:metal ABC transporter substrate-binding protein [Stomatobaculum longum]